MVSTFRSKEDFLAAVSSKLDAAKNAQDVRAALVAGISSADDALTRATAERESLALNLKVGTWVIRDDDLPLFQALNTAGAAIALTLTTGGMAWPAIVAALTGFADLCWRAWRRGVRLSSLQVAVYGFLQARGPTKADALCRHMRDGHGESVSLDVVTATLASLHELDTNDGRVIALAARDEHGVWRALRI